MERVLFVSPNSIYKQMALSKHEMFRQIVRFEKLIGSDTVKSKDVLEIGSGSGVFSSLMCLAGAKSVTAMEPVAAGNSSGILEAFEQRKKDWL